MKDERAFQHYSRLIVLGIKQDLLVSLGEVAEVLCTTPRHCRTLLQSLQQREWLNWTPKSGRNQRSILHLNFSPNEIQTSRARLLIEKGNYENALELLEGDQNQFSSLLQQTSGALIREGQLHIQLTYQRIFSQLLPHKPLRNSERFLVRQVYACLTACDRNGVVKPQLAHHWQQSADATKWRFYIRPQLRFHSNSLIDAELICDLFTNLCVLPEYEKELAHVRNISASHQCVTFELSTSDQGFAALLSDLRYSIQPARQIGNASGINVDGCGPFRMVEQSDKRVRLQAFDHYFSTRSLTDSVTIWQFDHTPSERIQFGRTNTDNPHQIIESHTSEAASTQTRIENGCLYLVFNMNNGQTPLTHAQRKYLSKTLSPELVLQEEGLSELLLASIPAHSLLPDWTKVRPQAAEETSLPAQLDIAVYDHLVILDCARVLSDKLNQMGVESRVNVYSFSELHERAQRNELSEGLVIASLITDDNLPISMFRWFCSNSILHQGLPDEAKHWINAELAVLRGQYEAGDYLKILESLATTMLYENWIAPLFHHRQTLKWLGVLQGVSMTDWSWPDFKNVWTDD
ncbi:SgrR family transcriptional regulator [Enterovibrio coralii]|uniref:SgrR family transcriptional regulator n=1 Tax=Enterovibrio coralii TaxID=294935 RepID=UPI000B032594|nr:SgrR family transcriptional regulator [Enterovibrio coralii]